ncbi:MAG TPA: cytochrome c peroxidase [Burkholderiales bacterium]|nr:cytochrome c peroxidase [Burkholderiales bacterium]
MAFLTNRCLRAAPLLVVSVMMANIALAQSDEPLDPLPNNLKFDQRKVTLGSKLFRDSRFAKDNSVACISCHSFQHGGADPRPVTIGAGGVKHIFNSPSVFNSGFNFRQQWTGGAVSLEDLTHKVVKSPRVFGSTWEEVIGKLSKDEPLVSEFKTIYSTGMTPDNIADALAVYQRSLITPSRFDKYLRGDSNAITADEKLGYQRFKAYGCVGCHQGVNVGGNMVQKFGAMRDYFADRVKEGKPLTDADKGRFNITKDEGDLHTFKVPSLRNVALTSPYFHNGAAASLEEAVDVMFRYQLGRTAPAEDKALIIKFLKSLTGEIKE